jgi:hypothetical protein
MQKHRLQAFRNIKPIAFFCLCALISFSFMTLSSAEAATFPLPTTVRSQVVCSPDSHNSCLPGPYVEEIDLPENSIVVVKVFLEHTGSYEPNEASSFFSSIGAIDDCGPIPPETDEIYCGSVIGQVNNTLSLGVQHAGKGNFTGSHRQRYEVTLCHYYSFLPFTPREVAPQ